MTFLLWNWDKFIAMVILFSFSHKQENKCVFLKILIHSNSFFEVNIKNLYKKFQNLFNIWWISKCLINDKLLRATKKWLLQSFILRNNSPTFAAWSSCSCAKEISPLTSAHSPLTLFYCSEGTSTLLIARLKCWLPKLLIRSCWHLGHPMSQLHNC